ncbi:DUF4236 domain-containing protein [Nocardia ninae]|uniref:DUF2510 domain-containing protein n=1 Tax=Nocardia ninae NBRC 108245 TaxID=1210091 RepID=A0A511MEE7_9NOCA|nr:DUF4236 domain-containing protein [Nocardia ninae]GEM38468.1 hypothetical protein NN4_29870 [Nocardia ninae NBRC 108245]
MVQFRKSKKLGPVRFTASKKGIGVSAGAGPVRVGIGADGKLRRTLRVPGTGIYDTKVVGHAAQPANQATSQPAMRAHLTSAEPRDVQPLALPELITAKGHDGTITFDGWWINIQRTGVVAKLSANVNGYESRRIPLNYLEHVEWKSPSMLVNGYLKFVVIGEDPEASTTIDAAANPNAVLVTKQQVKRFEPLREALAQALAGGHLRTVDLPVDGHRPPHAAVETTTTDPVVPPRPPPPSAPAGWYPDSAQPTVLRWWDGTNWTEHTAPSR